MKKIVALVTVFTVLTGFSQRADASTILIFGQAGGANLFVGDGIGGLDADDVPIIITTLNEGAVTINAFFNFEADSTALATNIGGSAWTQPYSGGFQITSGLGGTGFNYLSGLFDGIDLGIDGGTTMIFGSTEPPLSLSFSSDVVGMPLDIPTALALGLTDLTPPLDVIGGVFQPFAANVSGNFSATPAVPEPASLILLGSGLLGLVHYRRKRASL